MNASLSNIFQGNFLIHPGYASSFIPVIYKALTSDIADLSSISDFENALKKDCVSNSLASEGTGSGKYVAIISIKHPIVKFTDYTLRALGSKTLMSLMDNLTSDPNISGVVLDIDSGGGQVYGTPEFYDYIKSYPKPTGAFTDGYLCSAAFYIAAACNFIIAHKRADAIGSLGAYSTVVDLKGILEKLGGKVHTMYATKSGKKNFEHREVIDNSNYEPYITNVLDPIVENFHADMKATRPNLKEEVFEGGTWPAAEALEMGLIDEIGTIETAVLKIQEEAAKISNNQKPNSNMSKPRAKVQAVLGLEVPLASTDNGSYLNDEQLDAIETSLGQAEATASKLQGDLDAANTALTKAQGDLSQAQQDLANATTEAEASVDTMLTDAGLEPTGTLQEKLTALSGHMATLNAKDGAQPTVVGVNNKPGASAPGYFDSEASHNKLANEIFNK